MFRSASVLLVFTVLWGAKAADAANYRLAGGDVVAVIVHGVVGERGVVGEHGRAAVHFPRDKKEFLPAMGHPFLVFDDGKLHLPLIDPVSVDGLTVVQAQRKIEQAYFDADIVKQRGGVMLTLMRKRTVDVLVVHDTAATTTKSSRTVRLAAEQSSPLAAIVESGNFDPHARVRVHKPVASTSSEQGLPTGSMVVLQSPSTGYYFTSGRLNSAQHTLPTGRRLSVLEAVTAAGGVNSTGWLPPHRVLVVRPHQPPIVIPWSRLLTNPSIDVQSGDTILVE